MLPDNYSNYIFDLYGTLVDIHTDESSDELWKNLSLFMSYYKAKYTPLNLRDTYQELVNKEQALLSAKRPAQINRKDSHEASPEIDIRAVFQKLYTGKNVEASEELILHTGQFFRALSTRYLKLYPGTKAMLTFLRESGKKVYLLSNAQRSFTAYELDSLGITDCFDDIFISSDYGTKKPDSLFFKALIEKHKLDVKESIYIGNDSICDIYGASRLKMDTFYVHTNISPKDDAAPQATYSIEKFTGWED